MTRLRLGFALLLIAFAADACAFQGLHLTRRALGCYHVSAEGWTSEVADFVGFEKFPAIVVLDSALSNRGGRAILVPREWRFQDSYGNRVRWGNEAGEWHLLPGDTLIFARDGLHHVMAGDSIVMEWSGPEGLVTAFLAPTVGGYSGLGQLSPRQLARGLKSVWIHMRRTSCGEWSGRLVPGHAP